VTGSSAKHILLSAGTYRITVTVADQVGNAVNTTRSNTITPAPTGVVVTPRPTRGVKAQLVLSWRWLDAHAVLRSIAIRRLPKQARIAVSCTGRDCPRLRMKSATAKNVKRLVKSLAGDRFRSGDKLRITITAPHLKAERVQLTMRYNRKPTAQLLKSLKPRAG
jgi:hypothetical protein